MGVTQKLASAVAAGLTLLAAVPATSASAAGTFTAFALPADVFGPDGITSGLDGNLWITDAGGNIIRMTTAGSTSEFPLLSKDNGPQPAGISVGPDGNIWFAEVNGGNIGRVTRTGAITEFPVDPPDWFSGITPGWDGNLWFGERFAGSVARMTPQGVTTAFPFPVADVGHDPIAVTIGPRRSVWVSDESAGIIWQVSMSGALTPHPMPDRSIQPNAITVGPDGNLWFGASGTSNPSGTAIGKMTPQGIVSLYPISGFAGRITAGPDGKIWFTEFSGKVGSITTSGRVTELDVPGTNSVIPLGITTGPDGNIWFTDSDNLVVWRLTIPHRGRG